MSTKAKESGLEVKVGLFICLGFLVIAAMIIEFGLGGSQGFTKFYPLQVDLPDANGLLKGSDVLLAGARVGFVSTKPVLAGNLGTVRVTVNIEEKYKIPRTASFKVSSSGLLGDKFVSVTLAPKFDATKFDPNNKDQAYQPNDTILGKHEPDIFEQAQPAIEKLSARLDDLSVILDNLKKGIFSPESQKDLQGTIVNLKSTTDNWSEASKGLGPVVKGAQDVVDKAGQAMTSANQTMATAKQAAEDLRKTLGNVQTLVQKASQGEGLVGQLLTNKQLADNFNALVINLREHGVLFYKNSSKPEPAPQAQPAPRKNR